MISRTVVEGMANSQVQGLNREEDSFHPGQKPCHNAVVIIRPFQSDLRG